MCACGQDHHAPMPRNQVVYWWCKEPEEDVPQDDAENDEEVYHAVMDKPVYDRSMESLLNVLEVFTYYHDKERNFENEEGAVNCRLYMSGFRAELILSRRVTYQPGREDRYTELQGRLKLGRS